LIIDTHSHLYGPEFEKDIDAVLERAQIVGVAKIFLPNINAASTASMLSLAARHPGILYPMIGLHPEDIGQSWREVLPRMEALLACPEHPFIAVGEVGLDYYWDSSLYDEQQEALDIQVGWALHYDLPLMIHTRKAHQEMVKLLKRHVEKEKTSNGQLRGVFHCFGGSEEEAEELLRFQGFMLGIGGVLTYKKSHLPEVLKEVVPLDRIVLETDAPYLAPVPYRGKRNESAFLIEVVKRLSEIYDCTVEEVASITTRNALNTFPKAQS